MIRGTTPTVRFRLKNLKVDLIQSAEVDFGQRCHLILEKVGVIDNTNNTIFCSLSEEETLLFDNRAQLEIQLKVLTTNNIVAATKIFKVEVSRILNEEVLING